MVQRSDLRLFTPLLASLMICSISEFIYAQQFSEYANVVRRAHTRYDCNLLYTFWGYTDLSASENAWIGRNDNVTTDQCEFNGRRWESFRMQYKWDLSSIPSNATITSVKVEVWYTSAADKYDDVTISLRKYPLDQWDAGHEQRWLQIGSGSVYASRELELSSANEALSPAFEFFSGPIVTDLQNSLPSAGFILGVTASGDEEWTLESGRYRFVNARQGQDGLRGVKLTVNYTIPITVTVRNGIPNYAGTVKVDGMQQNSPYTTPSPWTSGTSHTLESTTQFEGGTTYVPTGTWTNITTGEVITQNPATVRPIANTIYQANLTPTTATVTVDQRRESNSQLTGSVVGRWQGGAFTGYTVPISPFTFGVGSNEVLKGHQDIITGPDEKYNRWERNGISVADVTNHHNFPVTYDLSTLTSRFKTIHSSFTIQTTLTEGGSGGTVEFKDPWLIDYADPSYGNNMRNRGITAAFKSRTSPFLLDFTTSYGGDVYKGVFLDQNPTFDPQLPIYSIRAPLVQTINGTTAFFQGWSYDPNQATLAPIGPNPSGFDEKAIVFKQTGATITATYTNSNITTSVTIPPGSYNISQTLTVAPGATLTLSEGTTFNFTGFYKLIVNGSLVADGATLKGNGTRGSWFGVELNNWASTQVVGWTVKDAQRGLFLANSNMAYPSGCSFQNNTNGIYITGYSDPTVFQNGFTNNSMDVFGDATSVPDLGSAPGSGYNSFRSLAQVNSWYSGTIFAWYNWWGSYPPNPNVSENVDYTNPLSSDPNPSLNVAGNSATQATQYTVRPRSKESKLVGDDQKALNDANRHFVLGNFEDALNAFQVVIEDHSETFAAQRAVVFVERCLDSLGRSHEIPEYLNTMIANRGGSSIGPFLQFRKAITSARISNYMQAMEHFEAAINTMRDTTDLKIALYAAGSVAFHQMNDRKTGEAYLRRLITEFPDDPMSVSAMLTLGETPATEAESKSEMLSPSSTAGMEIFPNPFNPSTSISFTLPEAGHVSLKIYDSIGRIVATLVNEERDSGRHKVLWNAGEMPSGAYFSRLEVGGRSLVQKLILVR